MKFFTAVLLLGVWFLAFSSVGESPAEYVIIVSIDGLSPTALEAANAPNIKAWRKLGARANNAQAVIPAITLTNHASMISGVGPTRHLMVVNFEFCNEMRVPSIFDLGRQNGLKTAMVASKTKFDCLTDESKLTYFSQIPQEANMVAIEASKAIEQVAPNVMLLHFSDVDWLGHSDGWYSSKQIAAVENVDRAFGTFLKAVEKHPLMSGKTVIILTADHGGHDFGHLRAPEDTLIPWYAVGPGIPADSVIREDLKTYDTAAMAAQFLGLSVPQNWRWLGRTHQFTR
jgi:predicted AlkP superfamily pyrophosphatase or phosphodiesterase